MNSWKEDQDNCCSLLCDPDWEFAIKEGGKKRKSLSDLGNILVVTEKNDCLGHVCSEFSVSYLGSRLSNLRIGLRNNMQGVLGVSEAALVAEIVAGIVSEHPNNRGCFWLFSSTLRALVCIVLAVRSQSCVNQEGVYSHIDRTEIINLRKMFLQQPQSFILSTQSVLFVQNVGDISQDDLILLEEHKIVKSLDLPRNIVDRFIYKYVEAKLKKRDQKNRNNFHEKGSDE